MKQFGLSALLARMKYIPRWSLMRSIRTENLCEHTADTALLAHMLCLIATQVLGQTNINPERVATAALYHDAPEILTGDLPTPVKYKNAGIQSAYQALEAESAYAMAGLVPEPLSCTMHGYLTTSVLNPQEKALLKAADHLSALIKCMEENELGNHEFAAAMHHQHAALCALKNEAVDYFMAHFLPCYALNLDELTRQNGAD